MNVSFSMCLLRMDTLYVRNLVYVEANAQVTSNDPLPRSKINRDRFNGVKVPTNAAKERRVMLTIVLRCNKYFTTLLRRVTYVTADKLRMIVH